MGRAQCVCGLACREMHGGAVAHLQAPILKKNGQFTLRAWKGGEVHSVNT